MQSLTQAPTAVTALHHSEPAIAAVVEQMLDGEAAEGGSAGAGGEGSKGALLISETSITW
jgi:hypothetical protein